MWASSRRDRLRGAQGAASSRRDRLRGAPSGRRHLARRFRPRGRGRAGPEVENVVRFKVVELDGRDRQCTSEPPVSGGSYSQFGFQVSPHTGRVTIPQNRRTSLVESDLVHYVIAIVTPITQWIHTTGRHYAPCLVVHSSLSAPCLAFAIGFWILEILEILEILRASLLSAVQPCWYAVARCRTSAPEQLTTVTVRGPALVVPTGTLGPQRQPTPHILMPTSCSACGPCCG